MLHFLGNMVQLFNTGLYGYFILSSHKQTYLLSLYDGSPTSANNVHQVGLVKKGESVPRMVELWQLLQRLCHTRRNSLTRGAPRRVPAGGKWATCGLC